MTDWATDAANLILERLDLLLEELKRIGAAIERIADAAEAET